MPLASAVFFDLDGTLLDTAPEFASCMNALLTECDLPSITTHSLRSSVSQGALGMIKTAFQDKLKNFNIEELRHRFLQFYRERIGSQTHLFKGITPLLEEFHHRQIPWGIVTNKPSEFTQPLVQQFSSLENALCIVSGDTLKVSKPHPEPLFLAAKQLQKQPEQCWYVGDAKSDVEASRAAGMKCMIVNYGYLPLDDDPESWQADHYIDHPEQILDYLNMR